MTHAIPLTKMETQPMSRYSYHCPFRGIAFLKYTWPLLAGRLVLKAVTPVSVCTMSLMTRLDLFLPNLCRHFISYMF